MISIDIGNSKICAAVTKHPEREICYVNFLKKGFVNCIEDDEGAILLPTKIYFNFIDRKAYIGREAMKVLQEEERAKLLKEGKAIYISSFNGAVDYENNYQILYYFLMQVFSLLIKKISPTALDDKFVVVSRPVTAGRGYLRILEKCIRDSGLVLGGFLDEPISILLASRLLDKASENNLSEEFQRHIIIDAGAKYLTLTSCSCHVKGTAQSTKWEVNYDNVQIIPNISGLEIEEEMFTYLLKNNQGVGNKPLEDIYYRETIRDNLRFDKNLNNDHYLEDISKKWISALREFNQKLSNKNELDSVIISGGVSRSKKFRQILEQVWQKEKILFLHPDLAVAEGGAIYGAGLGPELSIIKDYNIGIGFKAGPFYQIISRAELPESLKCYQKYQTFTFNPNMKRNLESLTIWAYYGLSEKNIGNIPLGCVSIDLGSLCLEQGAGVSFIALVKVNNIDDRLFGSLSLYDNNFKNLYGKSELEFPNAIS